MYVMLYNQLPRHSPHKPLTAHRRQTIDFSFKRLSVGNSALSRIVLFTVRKTW